MVFVLDKHKRPLMPCSEKRARQLLERKRAVIHKISPFTIRLKDRIVSKSKTQPLRLKLDPGSKVTGFAILRKDNPEQSTIILLGELHHKPGIKSSLDNRRALRRSRRNRKTRYRKPRFNNRKPAKCAACGKNSKSGSRYCRPCASARNYTNNGHRDTWLPPSLQARVNQTMSAVNKLTQSLPITAISTEHVKFDTQLIQNPNIVGIEYQQGELLGYEIREYLLEKWNRKCAYCGKADIPLEVEHITPKSRGGSNRISNLAIACRTCNQKKGNRTAQEFGYPKIQAKAKLSLKDAAMMNATRWALYERLKATGLSIECGTGARTKMQRISHKLTKTHYYDAVCVGASTPANIFIDQEYAVVWSAKGRGSRKMCNTDKYGFPKSHRTRQKQFFDFQTGDIVVANIPRGKYQGRFVGRVAVRASGYFDIKDGTGKRICQGISWRYMQLLQRNSGWQYEKKEIAG
jgi:5-methylcytosine-specific restriction endonuclease McrA